jgi:GAF domain-containing protein
MRMIQFQGDGSVPVYINPQLVRAVTAHSASQARIHFDQQHFILVQEKADVVAHAIENVR